MNRRLLLTLLAALLVLPLGQSAHAQVSRSRDLDVNNYRLAPGWHDHLAVESAALEEVGHWNLVASLNYAYRPLRLVPLSNPTNSFTLIRSQLTLDMGAVYVPVEWLEASATVPLMAYQVVGDSSGLDPQLSQSIPTSGLGDLRVAGKARLFHAENWAVAGALTISAPTSRNRAFMGRNDLSATPAVLGEFRTGRWGTYAGNLGLVLRGEQRFVNLNQGIALDYALGGTYPFRLQNRDLEAQLSVVGVVGLTEADPEERPLELLAGVRWQVRDDLRLTLGAGPGIGDGGGTPTFRVFAIATFGTKPPVAPAPQPVAEAPTPIDTDGDGLVDTDDACPQEPEDFDDFEDDDGCPEPGPISDRDGDGIADADDRCPDDPEDADGFEDDDGCPEEGPTSDLDGDGIPDPEDGCPTDPEDRDGFEDTDGCPDPDNDGDGVLDVDDDCRDVKEDPDGFADDDGCPDPDNDGDGFLDGDDECPNEAEIINGNKDDDGCPDAGKIKVFIKKDRIVILDKVYFATNEDVILHQSFELLDQVAATLRTAPEVKRVRVEGHTDSHGSDVYNLDLSRRRAESVRNYLIRAGIDADRLTSEGFGETNPIDDNATPEGRANNRRVEFIILEQDERIDEVEVEAPPPE